MPSFRQSDGIWGRENFKAENPAEQVPGDVALPRDFAPSELPVNVLNHIIQERRRADGGVENRHVFIRQALRTSEAGNGASSHTDRTM